MALHFSREELADRRRHASAKLAEQGLHGLIVFRQESMYWLTGYDTSGYSMFQGMWLGADGRVALLTRTADQRQSRLTSVIEDVRIWRDREGATPGHDLRDLIDSYGARGKRVGVEYHAYGLTGQRARMVDAALEGFCTTVDASDVVRLLRLVKSPAELACFRKAGHLADEALAIARRMAVPGAQLGAVYGAMIEAMMRGDGDPSASRWPMGNGSEALMVRYHTGHGVVGADDQVQFEIAGSYRHYHAALMWVSLTGKVDPRHRDMFKACRDALDATQAELRAGRTVGDVFAAHQRTLAKAGHGPHSLAVCGYTMGACYPPTWMDLPMIHEGNPLVLEPAMVFFTHMILLNSDTGLAMSLGETAIVHDGPCEPINHAARELIVN